MLSSYQCYLRLEKNKGALMDHGSPCWTLESPAIKSPLESAAAATSGPGDINSDGNYPNKYTSWAKRVSRNCGKSTNNFHFTLTTF